jgi:putative tricarboxylic transport membrane protein
MQLKRFDAFNLVGAVCVTLGGVALIAGALTYPVGTLTRMGPGYFPMITGSILAMIGLGLIAESRGARSEGARIRLRPVLAVFAALLWWGLTIERLGLVPSTVGLVILSSLAQRQPSLRMIAATAAFLIVFAVGIFIYALAIPIAAFRF